jgi:hypothetical protein
LNKVFMAILLDWNERKIEVAKSRGGVLAVVNPFDNILQTGIMPWPPPEITQKLYKSRQMQAYSGNDLNRVKSILGFYADLQSIHSEDAITWSVFGPLIYGDSSHRAMFTSHLLSTLGIPVSPQPKATIWLWRRLPHPDTLVSSGPEVDFGIQTYDTFLVGEAKWRSTIGRRQGKAKDKDQIALRCEFCQKYGRKILQTCQHFIVLAVSQNGGVLKAENIKTEGAQFYTRELTWQALVKLPGHPLSEELNSYFHWKKMNSKPV